MKCAWKNWRIYLYTHRTAFQAGLTFLWGGRTVAPLRFFSLLDIHTMLQRVFVILSPHMYGERITWFGLLISGQSGTPVWSKGSFTVWICIIYLSLRRQAVCAWFSEYKWSVYYPHAYHASAISLHKYSRIYLSLSAGRRRPWRTFSWSSFRHDARELAFPWTPHHTSFGAQP